MSQILYQQQLPNRLLLKIEDQSYRYFGDYHRVRLVIRCQVPVVAEHFVASEDPLAAAAAAVLQLGHEVTFEKTLERMGVAGSEVETTRQLLIDQFMQTNHPYLARDDFPFRFIALKLRQSDRSGQSDRRHY
jgi:hypothetical protein